MIFIAPAMLHYGVLPYEHYEPESKSKDTSVGTEISGHSLTKERLAETPYLPLSTTIMGRKLAEFADEMLNTITQKEKEEFLKRTYPNTTKFYPNDNYLNSITIKGVRFSPPATIVFWSDNTKTVVKAQNSEPFDAEKGLMACIIKRITGNTGRYNELFKKYIKEDK